jgi:valyl-tRNA synthetase
VVKAHELFDDLPFRHAAISGFVVDPDRKKLSKSKDNAEAGPFALLGEYGADAIRYWACGGGPGRDVANDPGQMKIGRRLAIKLLNASKFALLQGEPSDGAAVTEPLDKAMLMALADLVDEATKQFDAFDYARALERTETFFWSFCDDYLELVKGRAYGERGPAAAASARTALRLALSVQLRLLAPIMPFVTEEVWSWMRDDSIHRAAWPTRDEMPDTGSTGLLTTTSAALSAIRGIKSSRKLSMRTELPRLVLRGPSDRLAMVKDALDDLLAAGRVGELTMEPDDTSEIRAEAPAPR